METTRQALAGAIERHREEIEKRLQLLESIGYDVKNDIVLTPMETKVEETDNEVKVVITQKIKLR